MLIVKARNDATGTNASANYDVVVMINDTIIARGRVTGHNRALGWRQLLMEIAAMSADAEVMHLLNEIIQASQ